MKWEQSTHQFLLKEWKKPLKKRYSRGEDDSKLEYKDWAPNPKGALPTTLINISSQSKRLQIVMLLYIQPHL
jgi:hypothetical protein